MIIIILFFIILGHFFLSVIFDFKAFTVCSAESPIMYTRGGLWRHSWTSLRGRVYAIYKHVAGWEPVTEYVLFNFFVLDLPQKNVALLINDYVEIMYIYDVIN